MYNFVKLRFVYSHYTKEKISQSIKALINIEQKCPFIPAVATWEQLTFDESRQELKNFYSNLFVEV